MSIVDDFRHYYYQHGNFLHWRGYECQKNPCDLWIYQELIYKLRPDFIIECGTHYGGSAQFLGDVCSLVGHGHVITIDITPWFNANHPNVTYINSDSTSQDLINRLVNHIETETQNCIVILDSNHTKEHVLKEMELYARFVKPGFYLIVEDTEFGGPHYFPDAYPGPGEAVKDFLPRHPEFVVDTDLESRFNLTWNPGGYLKRI